MNLDSSDYRVPLAVPENFDSFESDGFQHLLVTGDIRATFAALYLTGRRRYERYAPRVLYESEIRSRVFWVVIMVLIGTIYMLINVMNMYKLSRPELEYELVSGPPPKLMLYFLAAFTLMNMTLYIPETFNTLSVFFREGNTLLSLTLEMIITISLVHIPIAALNFFVAKCRAMQISLWQVVSGVFSIIFVFMRILWFAHMQGKKIKVNDKRDIKQGVFLVVCVLFSCAMAFQIMSWKDAALSDRLTHSHTHNVTIMLLDIPYKLGNRIQKFDLTNHIPNPAFHMKNLEDIRSNGSNGSISNYICQHGTNYSLPLECMQNNTVALKFKFVYQLKGAEPFGEILFNYAKLHTIHNTGDSNSENSSKDNHIAVESIISNGRNSSNFNQTSYDSYLYSHSSNYGCVQSQQPFQGNWKLWYFTVTAETKKGEKNIFVESPWKPSCSPPHPKYEPGISVC